MNDRELLAAIDALADESYGFESSVLETERRDALDRYYARPYGDEIEDRSQVCTTDLRDTIEWMIPQLLRVFLGGDEAVKFLPRGPEDEELAQQETDYVNHIALEKNAAFEHFSTWFRDALLMKNGYVKLHWKTRNDVLVESYAGLTDDSLSVLMSDAAVQVAQHTAYPDPSVVMPPQPAAQAMMNGPPQAPMLHDVMVRRVGQYGYACYTPVPPEEMRVHRSHRDVSLQEAIYVEHRVTKTLSELRQDGYDIPDDWAGADTVEDRTLEDARDTYLEQTGEWESADPATRPCTLRECYVRMDVDGDGIAELRKVCIVKNHILHNDETDLIPFACLVPIVTPHRHVGVSYYELVREIQRIRTVVLRQMLDNLYLANNGRYVVDVTKVNIDDLLVSKPGGIIRGNGEPSANVMPLTHPPVFEAALAGMDWLEKWRDTATGVNGYYQGLDPNALNKTATGVTQLMTAAQARVEAVARSFAETGVKDLFTLIHALTLKHATAPDKVKLRGKWATVDPREWVKRTNLSITVGLGTGSKEAKVAQWMQVLPMLTQGMQIGVAQPRNIYRAAKEMLKEMGHRDADAFLTDPEQNPPQQQKPVEVQAKETEGQFRLQEKQLEMQGKSVDAQQQAALDRERMNNELQLQASNDARQLEIERYKIDRQMELEKYKADLAAQSKIEEARIRAMLDAQRMESDAATESRRIDKDNETARLVAKSSGVDVDDSLRSTIDRMHEAMREFAAALVAPKEIVRDPRTGRASGVRVKLEG